MSGKILNKRSSVVVEGSPKLPTPEQLEYGEIAINFAEGHEILSIKNNQDEIITFSPDKHWEEIILEDEKVTAAALNDLHDTIDSIPVVASLDDIPDGDYRSLENYYMKNEIDYNYATSSNTHSAIQAVMTELENDGLVIAGALNDLNSRMPVSASQLTNDVGYITGYTETDPTVPSWAKQSTKPTYTANEVGALPTGTTLDNVPDGTTRKLSNYATSANTHNAIANASGNIKSYVDSKVSSVYVYKGSVTNYSDLASITTKEAGDVYNVVNANGSTPDGTNYAWTGTEWDALGGSIDLSNYVETSTFTAHTGNSAIHLTTGDVETQITSHNYITGYTETDPTVPEWAKQSTKPSYTASEVGALATGTTLDSVPDGTTRKLSNYATQANFTAHTGNSAIHLTTGDVKTQIEAYNYITGYTETDPTVPEWAKASTKPAYTASEVGALATGTTLDNVPDGTTRKLSNYATQTNFTAHTGNSAIHITTGDVKTQIESYNYLTGYTETDPTVPSWAKAETKPAYTASEVGALPTGTTLDNVQDGTTRKLSNYATQANFTAHTASTTVHVSSTEKSTWNGKQDAISDLSTIRTNAENGANAYQNMITGVTINGSAATVTNKNASINIETGGAGSGLPTVTSQDNGKILQVVDGQWALVTPSTIYTGQGAPDNLLGVDGDIYLQTS